MPRNDRSDSLSVRGDDDARKPVKAMEQEVELELGWSEATDTGGVEHQSRADREGISRERRPEERAADAPDSEARRGGGLTREDPHDTDEDERQRERLLDEVREVRRR